MIVVTVSAVCSLVASAGGVFIGHYGYDVAKLYRRNLRRARKLAQELAGK